ncbi:ParB/RepB/Spo0J family partition protein [Gluconacetobacter sp. 1c LMG 22058]|uniref:ParB/RepB/Spo0J family partition protein n=1 Tax=Gluconacetobacter dulcium TaxID=2729096 RepID=A0A7W4K3Q7_9PROT|nr:ParB/RepB/Spo0J family partition protein [Gluconacetobacter dulcium]MBB2199819.1 ParB/RepB/Spo0J family partition protein [Gluconacetobacter dulcium]
MINQAADAKREYELRFVDPRTLRENPNNPRTSKPDPLEDRKLALNIKCLGVLQPPIVREGEDGTLTVIYGSRRARCSVMAKRPEIPVLVKLSEDTQDDLAAGSENEIRQNMTRPEMWRWVNKMREEKKLSDKEIAKALMRDVAYIKGLSRLSQMHGPILHAIEIGRGPDNGDEKTIAMASLDDQRAVWGAYFAERLEGVEDPAEYRLDPEDPEDIVDWDDFVSALKETRFFASDARFDSSVANAYGVHWEADLFAPADEDGRFTTDRRAFQAAQQHWIDSCRPEGSVAMVEDHYGNMTAPEGFRRLYGWHGVEDEDVVAFYLSPTTLKIAEYRVRPVAETDQGARPPMASAANHPAGPKVRADISGSGDKMIGEIRTQALRKALDGVQDTVDPWDLVAGLLLAFGGENVVVQGDPTRGYGKRSARKTAVARLFPEGVMVRDEGLLREQAVAVVKSAASCDISMHSGSGLPAQLMGILFDADAQMPNMAFEDFLKTMSKAGISKAMEVEGLAPLATGKAMRAALIAHVGDGRWVPPAAGFAQAQEAWKHALQRENERLEQSVARPWDEEADDEDEGEFADDPMTEAEEPCPGDEAGPADGLAMDEASEEAVSPMQPVAETFRAAFTDTDAGRRHFDEHVVFVAA